MMKKVKSQTTKGLWPTDWWEIADGVSAIVKTSPAGMCSIKVRAGAPSTLHTVNASLPAHWQKSQSTDITRAVATGNAHDMRHLLHSGGIAMQANGVEDWSIEVDSSLIEGTLRALAENYELIAKA
jgi:hypothetical protein